MSHPAVPLGGLLKGIVAGKSLKTLERPARGTEFGILKISAVTWGEFRASENKAMPADYDPGDCPRAMKGDILISRANTRELVGAPVLVEESHPQLLLSDKLLKLIPDDGAVDRRYLVRVLSSPLAREHFTRCAGGTSGSMTNITQGDIRSAPIPLPPLPEQRRIAAILDKADALRAKRREAIAKLDQLLQSVFLDLFGDPVTNPKGWPTCAFTQCGTWISGATPNKAVERYWDGNTPWVSPKDMKVPTIYDAQDHVSEAAFTEGNLKRIRPGHLLIVVRGMILAHSFPTAINRAEVAINQDMKAILPKEGLRVEFLQAVVNALRSRILSAVSTAGHGTKRLDSNSASEIRIPLPPMEVQDRFVGVVGSLSALHSRSKRSAGNLEALFCSIQSSVFAT